MQILVEKIKNLINFPNEVVSGALNLVPEIDEFRDYSDRQYSSVFTVELNRLKRAGVVFCNELKDIIFNCL